MYFDRIEKMLTVLERTDLNAVMVCPSEELFFLAGFSPDFCERFQGLFITAKSELFYICNKIYESEIRQHMGPELKIYTWLDGESMTEVAKLALYEHNLIGKTIGVNCSAQAYNVLDIMDYCNVDCKNAVSVFQEARIIKTEEELSNLRKAAKIADEAFLAVLSYIQPGRQECDILNFLERHISSAGGKDFWGSAASGPNSGYSHYAGSERVIEEQDVLLMDFGCTVNGLYSDMTRTVFVGGVTDEQRNIYEIVERANAAGVKAAVNGAYIPNVDRAARDIIDRAGYKDYFLNRLGHGIGYMMHEAPDIKKNNCCYLKPGMCFSIEPCILIPGILGIQIEDIVAVTEAGNEVLNNVQRDLIII